MEPTYGPAAAEDRHTAPTSATELVDIALRDLSDANTDTLRGILPDLHAGEIAALLESMPPGQRRATWELIPEQERGDVLADVRGEARATLIKGIEESDLVSAAGQMEQGHLAEVLTDLPEDLTESVLSALDDDHRRRVEQVLAYPERTAGRLMSTDVLSVRRDVKLAVVLRWLFGKEIAVAMLNGIVWAMLVGLVAWFWFKSAGLALIIATAMVLNLLAAAVSGVLIPLFLQHRGIDPAISAAVILTTVTDIIGFLSFLGLATLFLL